MYKATIAIAILGFASSASALSCYYGTNYDGSTPSGTATGCTYCTKSVVRYTYGSSTTTQYTFGGYCTVLPTVSATSIAAAATAATAAVTSLFDASKFSSTCSAYTVYNPVATVSGSIGSLVSAALSGALSTCAGSSYTHSCGSPTDSGSYSSCTCCSDNCNGGGYKCGAASLSASMITMLIFAVVGYFMRQ